jgi:hypothetical protein
MIIELVSQLETLASGVFSQHSSAFLALFPALPEIFLGNILDIPGEISHEWPKKSLKRPLAEYYEDTP